MRNNYNYIGDKKLLQNHKIAFLCSRKCPASIILKSYNWAIRQREKGNCVISGFHSKIEKDVFHYLLKGNQPIILIEGRGLKHKYNSEITQAINEKRLLVILAFDKSVKRITKETAIKRNAIMASIADEIFIAYASANGKLIDLIKSSIKLGKKISTFDVPENNHLLDLGIVSYSS